MFGKESRLARLFFVFSYSSWTSKEVYGALLMRFEKYDVSKHWLGIIQNRTEWQLRIEVARSASTYT